MADYSTLKHEEKNLKMNAGNSLAANVFMTIYSTAAGTISIGSGVSGDSETAVYAGIISVLGFIAAGFCGKSHNNDRQRLDEVRQEMKGIEAKLGGK